VPFLGALDDILCIRHERVVGNDNCVRYEGRVLQIPEQRHRRHLVKVTVQVHQYPDSTLAVFHGPRRLAGYRPDGTLIEKGAATRSTAEVRSAATPGLRRGRLCGFVDNAARCPQPHRANSNSSGHLMCYENRTSSKAIDRAMPVERGLQNAATRCPARHHLPLPGNSRNYLA